MNVIFITLLTFNSVNEHNIYSDLLREFIKNGHNVTVFCASENIEGKDYKLVEKTNNSALYHVNTGKIQKTSFIKKGINTLLLDKRMLKSIRKVIINERVDLIIYTTPPITLCKTVSYLKKEKSAKTYLLLKDIFPQNSIDLGILKKTGLKSLIYKHFKKIERKLYELSDYIGCMSLANVKYIIDNNTYISKEKVEVCPNCIDMSIKILGDSNSSVIKEKYSIPENKKLLVYGGNLGKPQDIDFVIKCIENAKSLDNYHFVIVGDGTEYPKLESYSKNTNNITLIKRVSNNDYCSILSICDVALIFLDHRFTIPNYPSRLLDYMVQGLPIVACTDSNTDIKETIINGGFGYWCESVDFEKFLDCVDNAIKLDKKSVVSKEKEYLENHFSSVVAYKTIINHFVNEKE